jgi:transposase
MARPVSPLDVTPEERIELQRRFRASTTPQRESLRARIILLRAKGKKEEDVATELGVSMTCVSKWSSRFEAFGLDGLADKPGRGRKASLPARKIEQVLTKVTQPPKGRRRWSVRTMAKAVGISPDSVHRIWKQNDLKPHLTRTFKLSRDPEFEPKFWDVIGLYLNPPDKALVLCCDEKGPVSGPRTYPTGTAAGSRTHPHSDP